MDSIHDFDNNELQFSIGFANTSTHIAQQDILKQNETRYYKQNLSNITDKVVCSGSFKMDDNCMDAPSNAILETLPQKLIKEREQIFEFFHPWALKTYCDHAKTKTITLCKKVRILKALEGKEHSRPDSSKFRFWVKSKGFTTQRPDGFQEARGGQRMLKKLSTDAILSENPENVDLFVVSTTKESGRRVYRKVAVVEEFFDIIYNVHMELGGRSGMHAGQKRTYRIISETFAFLPREAVTRFLSICPECKKNMSAFSSLTSSQMEDTADSSSEQEARNNSSQTESSVEATPVKKQLETKSTALRRIRSHRYRKIVDHTDTKMQHLPKLLTASRDPHTPGYSLPFAQTDIIPFLPPKSVKNMFQQFCSSTNSLTSGFHPIQSFTEPHIRPNSLSPMSLSIISPFKPEEVRRSHMPTLFDSKPRGHTMDHIPTHSDHDMKFSATNPASLSSNIFSVHLKTNNKYSIPLPVINSDSDNDFRCTSPKKKKFKKFTDNSKAQDPYDQEIYSFAEINQRQPNTSQYTDTIDLTKQLSFRSNGAPRSRISESEIIPTVSSTPISKHLKDTTITVSNYSKPETVLGMEQVPPTAHLAISSTLPHIDLERLKPITSTYLQLTRSMGLSDEDALKFDNMESIPTHSSDVTASGDSCTESDPYAGLMKDADKLKLMLLAWNYQNSNAVRNGTEGPDLSVVGGLWAQYQSALAQTAASGSKVDTPLSPLPRMDTNSPMEAQDETNSSGQKEEDEVSEDDSDDKLDEKLATHDPERLKAFNMFVRLFVDENLDRIIPISKQPKEKIQAIIDSCARQFPEFSDRSRKRIRTYLKSCRRNKKTRDGWDNTTRPTPAHLTSVQAEQILAIACENESMNAKRMRIGLDPITHAIPAPGSAVAAAAAAVAAAAVVATNCTVGSIGTNSNNATVTSISTTDCSIGSTPASIQNAGPPNPIGSASSERTSPLAFGANTNTSSTATGVDIKPLTNTLSNGNTTSHNSATVASSLAGQTVSSPLYRPSEFPAPSITSSFVAAAAAAVAGRTSNYPGYFPGVPNLGNVTPTDLSMKHSSSGTSTNITPPNLNISNVSTNASVGNSAISVLCGSASISGGNTNSPLVTATQQLQQIQQQHQSSSALASSSSAPLDTSTARSTLLAHKLTPNEVSAARQVISAYRESAAFLLRTADQVEQLLVQQQ